ncbi:hypothetical protein H4N58_02485 [Mumia sp. ZJ1417]|uniref:hypothetical protein n=1 Tax=Mumia sp. ZJ1417 TaxID=2708082 RepID=UPI001420DB2E|nr:hypothetical protein [Mumia sp. ZJ1417]QMW66847.1 hypothetical protein H4N58_02485 [Mumia sp. ZJ1417]
MSRLSRTAAPVTAVLCGLVLLTAERPLVQSHEVRLVSTSVPTAAAVPDATPLAAPRPTKIQREVGRRITALLTPPGEKPADGLPVGLDSGVIGVIGSTVDGYTLVVTRGTDGAALVSKLTADLPDKARQGLEIRVSGRTADELRAAWAAVFAQQWRTLAPAPQHAVAVELDPEREAVVVVIGSEPPDVGRLDTLQRPLRGVEPGAVVIQYGGAAGRAVGDE